MSFGFGGWVAVDDVGLPGVLYVRMRDAQERLRISEFYIDASHETAALEARDLRDVPLAQIEEFINLEADLLRHGMNLPAPDLSTLASHFSSTFGNLERQIAEGDWVVSSFVSQYLPDGVDRAVVCRDRLLTDEDAEAAKGSPRVMRVAPAARAKWRGLRKSDREFRLQAGPADGLTDEFLREVARAYSAAILRGERPNVAIAEQTGYPLKSVQRWVYTARLRRIMPRGQQGRAG
ncbi:hypothetical protein GCM10010530_14090 [Kribbella aluminosa]